MNDLEKTIYSTLAYFSFFSYPLTAFELWKWQYRPERIYTFQEITQALAYSDWLSERIATDMGMYCLGTPEVINKQTERRKIRYKDSIRKERKIRKVLSLLARLDDVSGVALCNNMPLHFTGEQSDIDFFILTKPGRVWSARLATVLPMMLLRQRPGEAKQDPIDFSFFIDETAPSLERFCWSDPDPYLAYWIKQLTPIYGDNLLWQAFFISNVWVNAILPNAPVPLRAYRTRFNEKKRAFAFPFKESFAQFVQEKRFPSNITEQMNKDSKIVVNDKVLKFHKNDRRAEIARYMQSMICGL